MGKYPNAHCGRGGCDETENAQLDSEPLTLIVPVKETKGHFFIKGLLRPFSHCIRIFSIAHDLFYGHKWSTQRERVGAASGRDVLRIR